ncbi:MAG: hypothetical protein KC613_27560, partial [Myxococcales bacterium]|nr:hypothetical protein [Myxococcales bacterium]
LLAERPRPAPAGVAERLRPHAAADFARLWPHVEAEAEARAHDAQQQLEARAHEEQDALRQLLQSQRAALEKQVTQTTLDFGTLPQAERRQIEDDHRHMERRLTQLAQEIQREPAELAELYRVKRARVVPVGLVYLWPEAG